MSPRPRAGGDSVALGGSGCGADWVCAAVAAAAKALSPEP